MIAFFPRCFVVKKLIALFAFLIMTCCVWAATDKDKKSSSNKVVDAGSFGIFLNGKRIATEKFKIEQVADVGTLNSEIKVDDGNNKSEQTAEMQVAANGELRLYKWRSTLPTHEESVVEPKDDFLIEHLTSADQKKQDVPYILPLTTIILDDNFFSQRELLVWRYLTSGCIVQEVKSEDKPGAAKGPAGKQLACTLSHFGVLVPRQHLAANMSMELMRPEKIMVKNSPLELNKIRIDADGIQWFLWLDDEYKVIKISIPANNVEVIRD